MGRTGPLLESRLQEVRPARQSRVTESLLSFLKSDAQVFDRLGAAAENPAASGQLVAAARKLALRWPALRSEQLRDLLASFLRRIIVQENNIDVTLIDPAQSAVCLLIHRLRDCRRDTGAIVAVAPVSCGQCPCPRSVEFHRATTRTPREDSAATFSRTGVHGYAARRRGVVRGRNHGEVHTHCLPGRRRIGKIARNRGRSPDFIDHQCHRSSHLGVIGGVRRCKGDGQSFAPCGQNLA